MSGERVSNTCVMSLGWQSNPCEVYRIETSNGQITRTRAKDTDNTG
jgi:hypothetical protein